METSQTFNTDILSIALMMLVLVIIPFYLIAKGKSYKPLKIGALILTVLMALLTVGLYVVLGLIYNSLAGLIGVFTLVLMLYYLLLYVIIRFQHQKNKHPRQSSMVFYILIILPIHVHVFIHTCTHRYKQTCMHVNVHIEIYMHVRRHICMLGCTHTKRCIHGIKCSSIIMCMCA